MTDVSPLIPFLRTRRNSTPAEEAEPPVKKKDALPSSLVANGLRMARCVWRDRLGSPVHRACDQSRIASFYCGRPCLDAHRERAPPFGADRCKGPTASQQNV